MAVVADIVINMQADVARMQSDLEKVTKSFDKMKKSLDIIKTASLVQLGQVALRTGQQIFRAAEEVYNFSRAIASMGNDIQRSANIAGMGIEQFQKWSYVAKMADVDAQSLSMGMKMLSRNMSEASQGSGKAAEAFKAMGIDVKSSTGGLKSLDDIMREMAGKFSEWQDGPEKIALSLAVFGRAGEALIPMLNLGKTGIQEFEERLKKLGGTISESTIESLSKSEDAFKDWEVAIQHLKMEMAPLIEIVAKLITKLTELIRLRKTWKDLEESAKGTGMGPSAFESQIYGALSELKSPIDLVEKIAPRDPERWKKWVASLKTGPAPEMTNIVKEGKVGTFQDPLEAYRDQSEKYKAIVDKVVAERIREQEDLNKEIERLVKEGQDATYDTWETGYNNLEALFHDRWNRERVEFEKNEALRTQIAIMAIEERAEYERELAVGLAAESDKRQREKLDADAKAFQEKLAPFKQMATSFMSVWDNVFANMAAGTKKFKDVFIDSIKSMGMAFMQTVQKMIMQWMMFQAIKAATSAATATAIMGVPVMGAQEGGVFTRPTHRIIGEAGPEAVIPLKNGAVPVQSTGKSSGNTIIFISSPDAEGVQRLFQRNSGAMINVIRDDLDNRGPLVDSIRGIL